MRVISGGAPARLHPHQPGHRTTSSRPETSCDCVRLVGIRAKLAAASARTACLKQPLRRVEKTVINIHYLCDVKKLSNLTLVWISAYFIDLQWLLNHAIWLPNARYYNPFFCIFFTSFWKVKNIVFLTWQHQFQLDFDSGKNASSKFTRYDFFMISISKLMVPLLFLRFLHCSKTAVASS